MDYRGGRINKWRWLIYPWAVYEDISAFLEHLSPAPETLDEARRRLKAKYGIDMAKRQLRAICSLPDADKPL